MYKVGKCLLSERLIKSGMTQSMLAIRTNIPKSQISEYVNNKHVMSLETAKIISAALNCEIEQLYEWISVADAENR